jgi:hypothetical protein
MIQKRKELKKHTQANPEDAEKDHNNVEKEQWKSALEGDKDDEPKNQERQLEIRASR